jgi:hypothetical protein
MAAPLMMMMMFAPAAEASSKKAAATTEIMQQMIKKKARSVQLVTFPDTGWSPVKVMRGKAPVKSNDARRPGLEKAETAETVTFDDSRHSSVRVIRGESDRAVMVPGQPRAGGMNLEVVRSARADSAWSLYRMALWALRCMILGDGPINLINHHNARAWLRPSRRSRLMALAKPIANSLF